MNWLTVAPEIWLLTMACVVLLVDLWVTDPQRGLTFLLTQITIGVFAAPTNKTKSAYFSVGSDASI